jgi:hypothetical protein
VAAALAAVLLTVVAFLAVGGTSNVSAAECGGLLQPPCSTTTSDVPTTTDAPTTTEGPTTTAAPSTTQAPTQTTVRPAPTTAAPTGGQGAAAASTTAPTPTSNPLIVPGPGGSADGAPGSTVPGDSTATAKAKNEDRTGTVVGLVIAGLLVVAILLSLLTYRFWRNTRPLVVHPEDGAPPTAPAVATAAPKAEVPLARP